MAFVTTFVGVSWAARGFPVGLSGPENSSRPEIVQPLPALVKSTFGDEHAKQYERKMWEAQHTAQSERRPALDKLRLDRCRPLTPMRCRRAAIPRSRT